MQWVCLAFTGKAPDADKVAPAWVFRDRREEPKAVPKELQEVAWDAWCDAFKLAVTG